MIVKERTKPEELEILQALKPRMELEEKVALNLFTLEKGYEGEVQFDHWFTNCRVESLIINDLLLEVNGTLFQIDSLVITQDRLHLFEVKNLEGDYYLDGDKFKTAAGAETKNPLHQLSRAESLLKQLLKNLGFYIPLEPHLVFINPEFTLLQAPLKSPIILPTQLNRFMDRMNRTSSKLTNKHTKLAEALLSLHIKKSPFTRVPGYEFDGLRKGVVCEGCGGFLDSLGQKRFVCSHCGARDSIESLVLQTLKSFQILFPDRRVTTTIIYDWSNGDLPRKSIRRVLKNNLSANGECKSTYYE
ncbi:MULTISPECIES: nuclease-related domain-containing protein [unclassified Mesobacillus]|uniref:nuclease-related domain-containing protein n=1 Tax=unclassified Mesobacillus TaxID=2675270 RepID=UPI00203A3D31|nr:MULTISPECIES: nuclease-related domain-containing protein [unclassified Mesobacillus]MCM3124262.1 NERD domain-containing protein [Mesobacillus sp. MER 33]MCM3235028.1 NERD domain-containing protein [Mesobacillus sp. MER 48]